MKIGPLESSQPELSESGFEFSNFRLEPDGTLSRGDLLVHLTPKELAALRYLLVHAGEVVTSAQLKQALWGSIHVTADSVPRCVSSLRARLEPDSCIETVYKRGYRLKGAVRVFSTARIAALPRLAIVPFACGLQVEPHLGRAISEETAALLTSAQPAIVSVLARDSVFALAARGLSALEIGHALQADLVLTGTLHAWTSHYRLRVEMIRVKDGTQIWTEDMLVRRDRAGALEQELVDRLASRLGARTPVSTPASVLHADKAVDSRAYDLYLRGHSEWQSLERDRMKDGTEMLQKAVEINPEFIAARVDLVHASITQSLYGFVSPSAAAEKVRRTAESIPDLARNAPSLFAALGWVSVHLDRDFVSAHRLFEKAAHLPYDGWTTRVRVMFALSRHKFDEALDELHTALHSDPMAPWLHARIAWTLHLAHRNFEAREQAEYCLIHFPRHESTNFYGSQILAFNGEPERAVTLAQDLVQRSPYFDIPAGVEAYAQARRGNRAAAQAILDRMQWQSRDRFVLRTFFPAVRVELGDIEGAIEDLRAGEVSGCPWFLQMLADPRLKNLKGHAEFDRMVAAHQELQAGAPV